MNSINLLIVDDETDLRTGIKRMLARQYETLNILVAGNGDEALECAEQNHIDICILDIKMPGMSGLELLPKLVDKNPSITAIMLTGFATIELAVEAVKLGAYDFISKPFEKDILLRTLDKALERHVLLNENLLLRQQVKSPCSPTEFVGNAPAMKKFLANLETISKTNYTTLVRGESGTGKELAARAIHKLSPRKNKPLIMVNCPAIPEHLLESELFGHVRGAFTGATHDQRGLFAEAEGGTICLDEVGDLPRNIQSKLLRVLQEHEVKPLGATKTKKIDVRVLALTNLDLETMISDKHFREDLFYRLNVVTLQTPSLQNIVDDIPSLIHHFSEQVAKELDIPPKHFSNQAVSYLTRKNWPGNVRQLQNVVRRLIMFCEHDTITPEEIHFIENGESIEKGQQLPAISNDSSQIQPYKDAKDTALDTFTTQYLEVLLKKTSGNISKAAELSDISRAALQKIMKRYNIKGDHYRNKEA